MNKCIIKCCAPEDKLHQKSTNHQNLNEKKFIDELISYNIESLKALEAVPIIAKNSPQDFLDEIKKIPIGELNLISQRDHTSEFNDNEKGKINTTIFNAFRFDKK